MAWPNGLEECGKNKIGNGLIWGRSTIRYTRIHSKHEKSSVPYERLVVSHVNPIAKEAV